MKYPFQITMLLTVSICVLGCGEGQEHINGQAKTNETLIRIEALASFRGTLYLGDAEDGVFQFHDNTQSWTPVSHHSTYTLAGSETTLYIGGISGIFRLDPNGKTLTDITPKSESPNKTTKALAVAGDTIYVGVNSELYRSTDSGNTWHQINTRWGATNSSIESLAVHDDTISVFMENHGFFVSDDGGQQWTAINGLSKTDFVSTLLSDENDLYAGTDNGIYHLTVNTTMAIPAGLQGLRIYSLVAEGRTLYAGTWQSGVFRSNDGGQSWKHIGLAGVIITALAIFDNRLYAGTQGDGLFFTDDGPTWHPGAIWLPLNKGLVPPAH